jgi:hypothetical protein
MALEDIENEHSQRIKVHEDSGVATATIARNLVGVGGMGR